MYSVSPQYTHNYSRIFKTITKDSTGAINQIGILGKSIHDIKRDLSSGQGKLFSVFGGNSVTSKDISAIQQYTNLVKSGVPIGKAWSETMTGCSVAAKQQVLQCKNNIAALEKLTAAQKTSTLAARIHSATLKAVSIAGNMLLFWGIAKGIQLLAKGISELNDDYSDLKNRIKNLKNTYDEQTQSIDRINEKLSDNEQLIDNILKLDTPTYVDLQDLENLRTQNTLLKENLVLTEKAQKATKAKLLKGLEKKFDAEFYSNDALLEEKTRLNNPETLIKNLFTIGGYNVYQSAKISNKKTKKQEIEETINALERLNELKEEALSNNGVAYEDIGRSGSIKLPLSLGEIDKEIQSYNNKLQDFSILLLSNLDEISQYDPNYESDYAKDFLNLNDQITKFLDFDTFVNDAINRVLVILAVDGLYTQIHDEVYCSNEQYNKILAEFGNSS